MIKIPRPVDLDVTGGPRKQDSRDSDLNILLDLFYPIIIIIVLKI